MVEEKMASIKRDLAVFQHSMLENDICTETHSLTLKVLGIGIMVSKYPFGLTCSS
jgi:hypothetical protein